MRNHFIAFVAACIAASPALALGAPPPATGASPASPAPSPAAASPAARPVAAPSVPGAPPAAAPPAATAPSAPAHPAERRPEPAVGFSKLVLRIEGRDEINLASADANVRLIERMRARGLHAVGAENLVFGRDETQRADFLVGGTVRELECLASRHVATCRIGIEWQLLDVAHDAVVYKVMSRAAVYNVVDSAKEHMAGMLLDAAMDRLIARDGFQEALHARREETTPAASHFADATLPRCAPGRRVSESADDLLQNIVVIKVRDGFGSGFFVSPEGLILTAAHVVEGPLKVRLRDGTEMDAVPVRVAAREDVALLRTVTPLAHHACVTLRDDTPASGTEVYAAGAPASLQLAFSLTRGIVSGFPLIGGQRRLQTDAPVNPGNSGGPIADDNGAVVGVVSSKIVGNKIEGVAFAVPTHETLAALGLHVGDQSASTDPGLLTGKPAPVEGPDDDSAALEDDADPTPSLDPDADRRREEADRERTEKQEEDAQAEEEKERASDRYRRTPGFAKAMRWGGLTLGIAGAIAIPATYFQYDSSSTTQSTFNTLQTWNTIGWIALVAGGASFGLSYLFTPSAASSDGTSSLGVGPGGVAWRGTF